MANLQNCALCGSRERPSDLHLRAGKYVCDPCDERVFELFDDYAARLRYIEGAPIAEPLDLFGRPMHSSSCPRSTG